MVRTIYIVFAENKVLDTSHLKQYMFLCSNDSVRVGDTIKDPRYVPSMQVVKITSCNARVQEGFTLKDIQIETLNNRYVQGSDFDIDKQRTSNMEEKRNIKVTLEQAMEWYNSGNSTLRTLALSAYTEDELKFNLKYINSKVCNTCFCASVPANEAEKYSTLADLAIIAKFFNGFWKKTTNNTGYFLGNFNAGCGPIVDTCNGVGVYQHNTVQYAGVVYFRNQEDAIKAAKILGKRVKSLFD